jgi:hypothetical protein
MATGGNGLLLVGALPETRGEATGDRGTRARFETVE